MLCGHVMAMRISIHALREEGDALPARRRWSGSYFYPRPPRGGRRFTGKAALEWKLFLSTPSARRTTKRLEGLTPIQKFLSTPSAGRATAAERPPLLDIIFLSTPSAGRATSCPCTRSRHPDYFYPRPPRGGRPVRNSPQLPSAHISIHALREEGDCLIVRQRGPAQDFYPRPPRGGRHVSVEFDVKCTNISIHALREEGDCPVRVGDLRDIEISIHALREEGDYRLPAIPHRQLISIHALREEGDHVSPS